MPSQHVGNAIDISSSPQASAGKKPCASGACPQAPSVRSHGRSSTHSAAARPRPSGGKAFIAKPLGKARAAPLSHV